MEGNFVYILYSKGVDKYYVGQTENIDRRLSEHNTHFFEDSFTKVATDWILKKSLYCETKTQALKIENHIKRNKSRRYIENFILYPEIGERLLILYNH